MLFDYRCRQFGAGAIHEGATGSFKNAYHFGMAWCSYLTLVLSFSCLLSLFHSFTCFISQLDLYISTIYQNRLFAVAGSIRGHPSWRCLPLTHQQLKCRCSIYVVLCNEVLYIFTHSFIFAPSYSLAPALIVCAKNFDELLTLCVCVCVCVHKPYAQQSAGIRLPLGMRELLNEAIQWR